jgi:hypothetical protein
MSPPTRTTHGEPIAGEQLERRLEELLHQDASRRRCGSLPTSASTTHLYTTRPGLDAHEFWAEQARTLDWAEPFTTILDNSNAPFYKWFTDGKLNVSYNCVDRHVEAGAAIASRSTGPARRASSGRSRTRISIATCAARQRTQGPRDRHG